MCCPMLPLEATLAAKQLHAITGKRLKQLDPFSKMR